MGTFQLLIRPFSKGAPLPLKSVAEISAGSHIIWNPIHLMLPASSSAEVAVVVVPASDGQLLTLDPRKAAAGTEWQLLERPQVIALLYGPQGLSQGRIQSLVTHNRELLRELADYADQSSQVESLVQQLADAQQSGGSTDAVLRGFSSHYGVDAPKLDNKASSDQQAALLLKTFLPAVSAYDPLGGRGAQVQQSGGLAASVAGLFFGNPVALAAGGAALFQNLKTSLFPGTDFRSAFAQSDGQDGLALCTKNLAEKTRARSAYLWAYRVPEYKKPALSIGGTPHLPIGSKSSVTVQLGPGSSLRELEFARDWRLEPLASGNSIPVEIKPSAQSLEIDLSKARIPPGEYQVAATWDWSPLTASGKIQLHPYSDYAKVTLAPGERDKLVEGNAGVTVTLTGADFEFLEKATLEAAAPDAKPSDKEFTLPAGKRRGLQDSVTLNLGTAKQGVYRLLLAQSDGVEHEIPISVLPPDPKISNRPIRVNAGEAREPLRFLGSGMERIEAVSSEAGEISGAPDGQGWSGEIVLKAGLAKGRKFPVLLNVRGLEKPVMVADAIEMVGPRPKIQSVRKSLSDMLGIHIGADELPSGTAVGLVLTVSHLHESGQPRLELACDSGERPGLALSPGEASGRARLTFAGPGAIYLSFDPGAVGYPGCRLECTIVQDPEGRSDRFQLGTVIRVPHLDKFTLTGEKVGDSSYAGILEGRDLDVIDKTGWDEAHGLPVESIPAPVPGDSSRETLRVVLPWPAPAPHAPLYIWLRGEAAGRKTTVAY